jgi:hypothetical protein
VRHVLLIMIADMNGSQRNAAKTWVLKENAMFGALLEMSVKKLNKGQTMSCLDTNMVLLLKSQLVSPPPSKLMILLRSRIQY